MPDNPFITIIIPTRCRPKRLRKAITSAVATVGCNCRVIVGWDDDVNGLQGCPEYSWLHKVLLPVRHYYVRAVNILFQYAVKNIEDFDYFVICNDDDEFMMPGWGRSAVGSLHNNFEDGMGVVELFAPGVLGHWLSRAKFFEENFKGRILEPCYTQYWADGELLDKLMSMNKYRAVKFSQQTIISHELYGTADLLANQVKKAWWDGDRAMYDERMAEGLIAPEETDS